MHPPAVRAAPAGYWVPTERVRDLTLRIRRFHGTTEDDQIVKAWAADHTRHSTGRATAGKRWQEHGLVFTTTT